MRIGQLPLCSGVLVPDSLPIGLEWDCTVEVVFSFVNLWRWYPLLYGGLAFPPVLLGRCLMHVRHDRFG